MEPLDFSLGARVTAFELLAVEESRRVIPQALRSLLGSSTLDYNALSVYEWILYLGQMGIDSYYLSRWRTLLHSCCRCDIYGTFLFSQACGYATFFLDAK